MSLLSTIAHEGAPSARRPSITAIAMTTVLALALATAGIAILQRVMHEIPGPVPAVQARLGGEEFLRLNTTDLPVVVSASGGILSEEFLRLNTSDLPQVVESQVSVSGLAGEEFLRLNTTDLPEVLSPDQTGPASGPR
jgi:hypothetical protein